MNVWIAELNSYAVRNKNIINIHRQACVPWSDDRLALLVLFFVMILFWLENNYIMHLCIVNIFLLLHSKQEVFVYRCFG